LGHNQRYRWQQEVADVLVPGEKPSETRYTTVNSSGDLDTTFSGQGSPPPVHCDYTSLTLSGTLGARTS
jgi:hypothetical protein